jgi:hypothetical protein
MAGRSRGYHRTFGQIQKKGDYEEMPDYIESGGTTKVPDDYTFPFYKADRIASTARPTPPSPPVSTG